MIVTNILFLCIGACVGGVATTIFNSTDNEENNETIDYEEFIKNMNKNNEIHQYDCSEDDEKIEIEEI